MPNGESASTQAVQLTRSLFEHIHGNLGVLRFSIEELTPTNGSPTEESKKWDVICSFFETLGSNAPTRYLAKVNLNDRTVTVKKLSAQEDSETSYQFITEKTKEK